MSSAGFLRNVAMVATLTAGTFASATPAHNVCVPQAIGVPSRPGPPDWMGWSGGSGLVEPALDDPRWLGASGQTFANGGALAPLHSRMLWSTIGSQKYLYMSFLVDLDAVTGAGLTTPRDVFVGFRRPAPLLVGAHNEFGYIFEFHLTGGGEGSTTNLITPGHCSTFTDCAESPGPGKNFWRVFVDHDEPDSCTVGTTTYNGPAFRELTGGFADGAPIDWMTNSGAPGQDAVRYWKLDASQPGAIQNRWAVQVRMKVAATDSEPLNSGIPPSSTFWYQAAAKLSGGDQYAAIAWWPRELVDPVCVSSAAPNTLVHPQLGDAVSCVGSSTTATCSPDNYSRFQTYNFGAPRPAGCDAGLSIDTPYIGSVVATGSTDFTTVNPTTSFKANAINTVLAQVVNLGPTDVTQPLLARFRLAHWGTAPWITSTDHGLWPDMRGAENGVCSAGTAPAACTAAAIPHYVDADSDDLADTRAPIKFTWSIGDSALMGNSEFCKFGLSVPAALPATGCTGCTCNHLDPASKCDADGDPGVRATIGSAANPSPPCVSKRIAHECMFVELSAPNGGVEFAQQSSWNNMNFDQMSTVSREALIDARQLPKRPGQTNQDIYLIAMPRNMPGAIPGGPTDGAGFVRERALERAEITAGPYVNDLGRLSPQQIAEIAKQLGRANGVAALEALTHLPGAVNEGGDKGFRERIQRVARALVIMPDKDFKRTFGLLTLSLSKQSSAELNEAVVSTVGPAEAAGIVPTLEIYPFYLPFAQGGAYLPMTAFTVFLGHEGSMSGMTWLIDGATKVGQNLYHLTIPVGYARKIQVRAQAIQPPEAAIGPNNPKWPCAGGCVTCGGGANRNCGLVTMIGNSAPGLIAGVLVIRRRRKKMAKPATASS